MQNSPLVTIICLSYNHASFVEEAISSIVQQSYQNIETIIIDDASLDQSVNKITTSIQKYNFNATFIALSENIGNCKAFNIALQKAKGKYVIDLAADDILLPERVLDDVRKLEEKGEQYGAVFSDVKEIDINGKVINESYYKRNSEGEIIEKVQEGDVYKRVLSNPPLFNAPSITFRRKYLVELGGYDETLAYEDFDIWIRLSRNYFFTFYDKVNTVKRILKSSHSNSFYRRRRNELLNSTFKICLKAKKMNCSEEENQALANSIRYHHRLSFFTQNFELEYKFFFLLKELVPITFIDKLFRNLSHYQLNMSFFYSLFQKIRR